MSTVVHRFGEKLVNNSITSIKNTFVDLSNFTHSLKLSNWIWCGGIFAAGIACHHFIYLSDCKYTVQQYRDAIQIICERIANAEIDGLDQIEAFAILHHLAFDIGIYYNRYFKELASEEMINQLTAALVKYRMEWSYMYYGYEDRDSKDGLTYLIDGVLVELVILMSRALKKGDLPLFRVLGLTFIPPSIQISFICEIMRRVYEGKQKDIILFLEYDSVTRNWEYIISLLSKKQKGKIDSMRFPKEIVRRMKVFQLYIAKKLFEWQTSINQYHKKMGTQPSTFIYQHYIDICFDRLTGEIKEEYKKYDNIWTSYFRNPSNFVNWFLDSRYVYFIPMVLFNRKIGMETSGLLKTRLIANSISYICDRDPYGLQLSYIFNMMDISFGLTLKYFMIRHNKYLLYEFLFNIAIPQLFFKSYHCKQYHDQISIYLRNTHMGRKYQRYRYHFTKDEI